MHRVGERARQRVLAGGAGVRSVVRVLVDVVPRGLEASRTGDIGSSRSATAFASSSLKRSHSAANGASDSALMFGITGMRTILTCGFAVRAATMNALAFRAVCALSV